MIIRGKDGRLLDHQGRKVNRRGYLIDPEGNVVTAAGEMIFKAEELDSDEEIPAPFCFEKKKEALFKVTSEEELAKHNESAKTLGGKSSASNKRKRGLNGVKVDQEDEIEKEYKRLREAKASHMQSSVDSLMGENPSKYNKKNQRVMPDDEDGFLSRIVQPMQAKSKSELMRQGHKNQQQSQT